MQALSLAPSRVFVTIDKRLYREALLLRLLQTKEFELCGESASGTETLQRLPNCKTKILVIEENLQDNDGLTVAEIAMSQTPSLIVALLVDEKISEGRMKIYLDAGIKTVIPKSVSLKHMTKALSYIQNGQIYLNQSAFNHSGLNKGQEVFADQRYFDSLSDREKEVAQMLGQRVAISEIAQQLGLSNKTVHTYKERIMLKMGLEQAEELLLYMKRIEFISDMATRLPAQSTAPYESF